ncbi:hypothetical protein ACWIWK_03640 [Helicobacter sp. 23-1048]
MKKIAVSSALCALLALPSVGLGMKVYDSDDKSLDFYGSIRGFVGGGAPVGTDMLTSSSSVDNGAFTSGIQSIPGSGYGSYLAGLQNNTHFGFNFKSGKVSGKIEVGMREGGALGSSDGKDAGFRYFYGTYDFDGAGKLSFGKIGTISAEGGFTSDFNNNNSAGQGFGSVAAASRHLQLQYQISSFTIQLIQDNNNGIGDGWTFAPIGYSATPRVAIGWTPKIENLKLKVAGTIKKYAGRDFAATSATAWHIFAGVRPTFGSSYLSFVINYGINGHLYGEQATNASSGQYGYNNLNAAAGLDAKRFGAHLEYGLGLGSTTKLIIGAGYQLTYGGVGQSETSTNNIRDINAAKVFIQLPIKPSKEFTFAPQISYMDTAVTTTTGTSHISGAVGMVRLMYDF